MMGYASDGKKRAEEAAGAAHVRPSESLKSPPSMVACPQAMF
jgi:hypothetical protein